MFKCKNNISKNKVALKTIKNIKYTINKNAVPKSGINKHRKTK